MTCGGRDALPSGRDPARSLARHEIIEATALHALHVHEDQLTAPLTPYGIASCAASTAYVLCHSEHWNHEHVKAQAILALSEKRP